MEETERQKDNRVSCESSFFVYLSDVNMYRLCLSERNKQ